MRIEAADASLDQILHEIAADTGAELQGLNQSHISDQRVFGVFGPGRGCDVLAALLEGSGYNVLMIGSHEDGMPMKIFLSPRAPITPEALVQRSTLQNQTDQRPEPQRQPDVAETHPEPVANPYGNGEPPRDPLQFMQEILDRQQKIDQQQASQQQANQQQP